jgi:integrase
MWNEDWVSYSARPRHPLTGRQFAVRAPTRASLAAMLHRVEGLRADLKLGLRSPADVDRQLRRLRRGPVTLRRATQAYLERPDLARDTRRNVRTFLAGVAAPLADVELDDLDGERCAQWMRTMRCSYAHGSLRTHWFTLRAIVRHASELGLLGRVPWGAWRPVGLGGPSRLPREAARDAGELVALLEAALAIAPELECKIATMALCGLRSRELARLTWMDIDFDRHELLFRGKGGKLARLVVPGELVEILRAHWDRMMDVHLYMNEGPVFPCPKTSRPLEPRFAEREVLSRHMLRAAVRAAGLPNPERWSPHSLRDTFATREFLASGGDLKAVADRTRHASITNLVRYLRSRSRALAGPPLAPALPR